MIGKRKSTKWSTPRNGNDSGQFNIATNVLSPLTGPIKLVPDGAVASLENVSQGTSPNSVATNVQITNLQTQINNLPSGGGDVTGPLSPTTDGEIALFFGTDGKHLQNSFITSSGGSLNLPSIGNYQINSQPIISLGGTDLTIGDLTGALTDVLINGPGGGVVNVEMTPTNFNLTADGLNMSNLAGDVPLNIDANNIVELARPSGTSGALILPRITTSQRDALTGIDNGTLIYNTTLNKFQGRENNAWVNLV